MRTIFAPTEVIQKWCAALRSGEYKQGQHRLQDGDAYCCLGVLQIVVDGVVERDTFGGEEDKALPLPSLEWLKAHNISFHSASAIVEDGECTGEYGVLEDESQTPHLDAFKNSASGANDEGVSFSDIADAIEVAAGIKV